MDVTSMNVASQNVSQFTAVSSVANTYANTAKPNSFEDTIGAAYALDISDEGKQAAAQAKVKAAENVATENTTTQKTKGLTADQIQSLKDAAAVQEQSMLNIMIQTLTANNNKLQGWLDEGTGTLNFGGVKVDASKFAMPSVATNPADAAKAVAEGGDWSVGAVADRIFGLAEVLAGGDPEKLEEMRAAVEKGFQQAGIVWNNATGSNEMPDITSQTYNELMHRFDTAMKKLTGGNIE